ncbi:MAG TPA: methylglyoxal synthase [Anaerolineales bacterium]
MSIKELPARKRIALVAHDGCKADLLDWAVHNRVALLQHELYGTGGTGALIKAETGLEVHRFMSGPLGGDQQIGAAIATGELDLLVFFWDPLQPQPHDPDVKALLRLAVLHNIPTASNRATADFLITSPLMDSDYKRKIPDFARRLHEESEGEED